MKLRIRQKLWRLVLSKLPLSEPEEPEKGLTLDREVWGVCEPPDKKDKRIVIRASLPISKLLEVFFHEQLHAALWDLDETAIDEIAADLARNTLRLFTVQWRTRLKSSLLKESVQD